MSRASAAIARRAPRGDRWRAPGMTSASVAALYRRAAGLPGTEGAVAFHLTSAMTQTRWFDREDCIQLFIIAPDRMPA